MNDVCVQLVELKKANGELKESVVKARSAYEKNMNDVKMLRSQVVQSPERVRREMNESQRALQEERRQGEAADKAALAATTATQVSITGLVYLYCPSVLELEANDRMPYGSLFRLSRRASVSSRRAPS